MRYILNLTWSLGHMMEGIANYALLGGGGWGGSSEMGKRNLNPRPLKEISSPARPKIIIIKKYSVDEVWEQVKEEKSLIAKT